MSPRKLHQQPLYLEPADAEDLDRLAVETSKAKQTLLREAVTNLFAKYRADGFLKPTHTDQVYSEEFRREVAREIRAGAAIDVESLVASGDLIPRGRNWYAIRNASVLNKVNQLVNAIAEKQVRDKTEIRVQLASAKKYKALAAKLRSDV